MTNETYYQSLHETSKSYKGNNWLVEELDFILSFRAKSILEIGCGNGIFLEKISKHLDSIKACDWAISPILQKALTGNPKIYFSKRDLQTDSLSDLTSDLVVSADVIEHLQPHTLKATLIKIDKLSNMAFHKIACYRAKGHLSVMPPQKWNDLFSEINPGYVIERIENRKENPKRPIVIITKGNPRILER